MDIQVTKWTPKNDGKLKGFADVLVNDVVEIRGCALREGKGGSLWVSVPSRNYKDETGQTKWVGHVGFPDDSKYAEFQEKSVKAIAQHGNAERFADNDDMPF